jgi:hypothetical protein
MPLLPPLADARLLQYRCRSAPGHHCTEKSLVQHLSTGFRKFPAVGGFPGNLASRLLLFLDESVFFEFCDPGPVVVHCFPREGMVAQLACGTWLVFLQLFEYLFLAVTDFPFFLQLGVRLQARAFHSITRSKAVFSALSRGFSPVPNSSISSLIF